MEVIKSYEELEEFIKLQQLARWIIAYDKWDNGDKPARVACATFKDGDQKSNLEYTESCLRYAKNTRLYMKGWRDSATTSPCYAEIMIPGSQEISPIQQMQQMVGTTQQPAFDREELMRDIRNQVKNEYEAKELERKKKELEDERKAINEERNSFMGVMAHYFAPVAQMLAQKAGVPVTGILNAGGEVAADTIKPAGTSPEEQNQEDFTDEEAAELESILLRLKKAEPEYMQLLQRVVELAEAHDSTYTMARGFLLK